MSENNVPGNQNPPSSNQFQRNAGQYDDSYQKSIESSSSGEYSPEERRICTEWLKEAMLYRGVPYGLGAGMAVVIRDFFVKPPPTPRTIPKIIFGTFIGHFFGLITYASVCGDRLMELPNSRVGAELRARKAARQSGPEVEKNLGEVLDLSTPQANTAYDDLRQKNRTS